METKNGENLTIKDKKEMVEVVSAIRNENNEYAGAGSKVVFTLCDGSTVRGMVERLLYGGEVLLSSGVKVNLTKISTFSLK